MNLIPMKRKSDELSTIRRELENLSRWFDEGFGWNFESRLPATFQSKRIPPIDVAESANEIVVSVELPGLEEKDIQIEMMGDNLCIFGERKWEEERKGKEYHRVESQYGSFRRDVRSPEYQLRSFSRWPVRRRPI